MSNYPKSASTRPQASTVNAIRRGWRQLLDGYPWFAGEGQYPLPAYSEFMPPPRLGRTPYGAIDPLLFSEDDPYGWRVSEIEEEYEVKPGLENIARQIIEPLVACRINYAMN